MLSKGRATALIASTVGAAAFFLLSAPLPLLLGPMAGCLVVGLAGGSMRGVGLFGIFMRSFLGVAIGASVTPELVSHLPGFLPTLAVVPLFAAAVGGVGYAFFRRVAGYDKATSFFSAMPGGLQDMLIFGEAAGGSVRTLSLVHATRVLVIFVLVPVAATRFWGVDLTNPPGRPASDLPPVEVLVMAASGLVGWMGAERLRVPGASIIGPMVLTAGLSLGGIVNSRPPAEFILAAQFFVGMGVGVKYAGVTLKEIRTDILAGLGYCVVVGAMSALFIVAIMRSADANDIDVVLAFLPGGQAEMALIAILAGADAAFVVAHHMLRLVCVILFAQAASIRLFRD